MCCVCGNAALTVCAPEHCGHNAPKLGLGLGHAAFVQKSWLDCGKSLLHTGVSPCVFCGNAALTVLDIVTTLWGTNCECSIAAKNTSVLAMQFLCRSHGWTVVNHYFCTQGWGLKTMCFLRQCCTHSLCPTQWCTLPQNWLGLGPCSLCAEVMVGLW